MRLGEWAQAWGSFGRALALNPSHALALENAGDLRKYLGEKHPIITANVLSPPPRQPRPVEHTVKPLLRLASLSPPRIKGGKAPLEKIEWWLAPFVLGGDATTSTSAPIEAVLGRILGSHNARYYPGGRLHPQSLAYSRPVLSTLRVLRGPAGKAGHAIARIGLYAGASDDRYNATLDALHVATPVIETLHPTAIRPHGKCLDSLKQSAQLGAYERLIHRRAIEVAAAFNSGGYMRRDRVGTASWHLQLRGATRWLVCPNHDGHAPASCATETSTSDGSWTPIDAFDPKYDTCPAFKQVSCLEAKIEEGDAIHVPHDWWAQAQAATPAAVALSSAILTESNAPIVASRLRESCDRRLTHPWDPEWGVEDVGALCAAMEPCLDKWSRRDFRRG